jgi:hypothetical protein
MNTKKTNKKADPYRTKFHSDRTVTVWNVFTQSWMRTSDPSDGVLASLNSEERDAVIRHCGLS